MADDLENTIRDNTDAPRQDRGEMEQHSLSLHPPTSYIPCSLQTICRAGDPLKNTPFTYRPSPLQCHHDLETMDIIHRGRCRMDEPGREQSAAGYSRSAIQDGLRRLRKLGLIAKPVGTNRKGFALTEKGLTLVTTKHSNYV